MRNCLFKIKYICVQKLKANKTASNKITITNITNIQNMKRYKNN